MFVQHARQLVRFQQFWCGAANELRRIAAAFGVALQFAGNFITGRGRILTQRKASCALCSLLDFLVDGLRVVFLPNLFGYDNLQSIMINESRKTMV